MPQSQKSDFPVAKLKQKEERRLLRGHLWAYRNEFATPPRLDDGAVVQVLSDRGRPVGVGFFQTTGGIAVRMLRVGTTDFDEGILERRIRKARTLRDRLFADDRVYRWVHGESDGLPGFVADRYGPLAVVQAASPFYTSRAETIAGAFLEAEGVEGVAWEIAGEWRRFGKGTGPAECAVHGITFSVDPESGQKTGLFLDQRINWTLTEPFAKDARVLDGHCYVGAWSLHAAQYGAKDVLGVDTSQPAIDQARANAERNAMGEVCSFSCTDIQEVLARDEEWDVIVLDPPALAKNRGQMKKALGMYQALNRDAMKRLAPDGVLITSSCSQPLDPATFADVLKRAATSAQRRFQLLGLHGAAPDHPVLLSMPETHYLTCAVLKSI
jgi:23S rRNA (cytosine1962-C5)-methyltransferase